MTLGLQTELADWNRSTLTPGLCSVTLRNSSIADVARIAAAAGLPLVRDARRIAETAGGQGLEIAFEYHGETLTDTPDSALRLLEDVGRDNVGTYWQPAVGLSGQEALAGLCQVLPFVSGVHAFPGGRNRSGWRSAHAGSSGRLWPTSSARQAGRWTLAGVRRGRPPGERQPRC